MAFAFTFLSQSLHYRLQAQYNTIFVVDRRFAQFYTVGPFDFPEWLVTTWCCHHEFLLTIIHICLNGEDNVPLISYCPMRFLLQYYFGYILPNVDPLAEWIIHLWLDRAIMWFLWVTLLWVTSSMATPRLWIRSITIDFAITQTLPLATVIWLIIAIQYPSQKHSINAS